MQRKRMEPSLLVTSEHRSELDEQVFVPPKLFDEIVLNEAKFCREIRKVDPREAVLNIAAGYKSGYNVISPYLRKYPDAKILEIGAGYGFSLCHLRKLGLNAEGIEPGNSFGFEGVYDRAMALLEANGISEARQVLHPSTGEALPFENDSFDIVYSVAVLEHVKDIKKCLEEAFRVVKPGGVICMTVPNYNSFFEGHYDILWLPYLLKSKRVAKWYVRTLFGRRDWFIDELHFTTPGYFRKLATEMAQPAKMDLCFDMNANVPIISEIFRRAAETDCFFQTQVVSGGMRFKHQLLAGISRFVSSVGELLGMAIAYRLVWELPTAPKSI